MKVIQSRNAHQALSAGVQYLREFGYERNSRNGTVLISPCPVATVYSRSQERIVFHPERDYNIAFVVYEALWMLAGRRDVKPLQRYVKNFDRYSNDGDTLHGAYGHRWRYHFGFDQLAVIADRLTSMADDRRAVVGMWDPVSDLKPTDDAAGKDVPCNDTITFQRGRTGSLDMTVFCRSNDMVWGAYYANAFHFGMLHEYMAHWIGCDIGTYTQISVNFHAYVETLKPVQGIPTNPITVVTGDPYQTGLVSSLMMAGVGGIKRVDELIAALLDDADDNFSSRCADGPEEPWARAIWAVLRSHKFYKEGNPEGAEEALVRAEVRDNDLIIAMSRWLDRRRERGNSQQS